MFAQRELFALFVVRTVRMVRTVRTVRRSHCSHGSNCSHCSLFALFEQFTLFAVRPVRNLRKKCCSLFALFGANSANKRTANRFVRSSVVPGDRSANPALSLAFFHFCVRSTLIGVTFDCALTCTHGFNQVLSFCTKLYFGSR